MFNKIFNLFLKLIPARIKTFLLQRITSSISQKMLEKWSTDTLEPLHQKITRLEQEVKKIKKMHDS